MPYLNTILFVEGNPVRYRVVQQREDLYLLEPENAPALKPPLLAAIRLSDGWAIEGTRDQNLIDQTIEDMQQLTGWP